MIPAEGMAMDALKETLGKRWMYEKAYLKTKFMDLYRYASPLEFGGQFAMGPTLIPYQVILLQVLPPEIPPKGEAQGSLLPLRNEAPRQRSLRCRVRSARKVLMPPCMHRN